MNKDLSVYEGAAAALVFFGNVGLTIPYKGAKSGEFTAMIVAFFVSVLLYSLVFSGLKIYKTQQINMTVSYVIGVVLVAFCLYVCLETSRHFIDFISTEVLIKNRKTITLLAFSGVCLYAFYKNPIAITKFSAPSLVFTIIAITILFLISLDNFNADYFAPALIPSSGEFLVRSLKYLYVFFVSPMVFPVFSAFYFKKPSLKTEIVGISVGMALLCVCFLSGILTFSPKVAAGMKDAYSKSISVISVGELFTRMEGVAYFIFFFSALIKTVVAAFSVKAILFTMRIKKPREITALLLFGTLLVSCML